MRIIEQIEQRVTVPGDGETVRSRKTLATLVLFVTGLSLMTNVLSLIFNGLTIIAGVYFAFALLSLFFGLLVLSFPGRHSILIKSYLILAIFFNVLTQFLYGGYSSGIYTMPWAILGPLAAVLLIGQGFTLASLAAFVLALISVIILEPLAVTIGPPIDTTMLLASNTFSLAILGFMVALSSLYLLRQVERYRARANELLLNMLPASIAARLKESEQTIADSYDNATVLFADMVGSTPIFSEMDPVDAVDWLNEVISMVDHLVDKYGLEKIRTKGDNYMVAAGVPVAREDHAQAMARLALDMVQGLKKVPARHDQRMQFRIGIHSGPLVAGVIGVSKYQYDLWGDTVNVASRMESHGRADHVQISAATYELIKDDFDCSGRSTVDVKGKGMMETYFLLAEKK